MSAAPRPSSPAPCGVPLQELHDALRAEGLAVAFEGDELVSLAATTRTRVCVCLYFSLSMSVCSHQR